MQPFEHWASASKVLLLTILAALSLYFHKQTMNESDKRAIINPGTAVSGSS